jgi:hypothetical protein
VGDLRGRGVAEVADELGMNYDSVVNIRRRLGIAPTRAAKRPIDVDEVRRRLEAAETPGDIGRALGHTTSAVSKVARRLEQQ